MGDRGVFKGIALATMFQGVQATDRHDGMWEGYPLCIGYGSGEG